MLDLSPEKILVLGMLALIVLGPNRLPAAARTLGRIVGQLRSMSSSFQTEVRQALHEPTEAFEASLREFRPTEIRRTVRSAVTSTILPPAPGEPGSVPISSPSYPGPAGNPDDPALN